MWISLVPWIRELENTGRRHVIQTPEVQATSQAPHSGKSGKLSLGSSMAGFSLLKDHSDCREEKG